MEKVKLFVKKHLKVIKIVFYVSLFFLIYGYSFNNLGNSLHRKNAEGNVVFSIEPLFTEGFIGPVRTVYQGFRYTDNGFYLLFLMLTSLWSPYAVLLLVYFISLIINIAEKKFF
jgi:hypothetical protein